MAALILTGGGDLTPAVPKNTSPDAMTEAMFRGDFGPLWDEYSFSEQDRLYDQEVNDPIALGAMAIGAGRTLAVDIGHVTAPALVYVGGNDQPEEERMTSDALGVEL